MLTARQQHCLNGIGIRRWVVRTSAPTGAEDIPVSVIQDSPPPVVSPTTAPKEASISTAPVVTRAEICLDSWEDITRSIHQCESCALAKNCTQKVPGVGNQQADLMIIGEGPGHDEDIKGEPFVGRSGQLLDKMLQAIGISRSQVFITNIVKCRPPNNRDPHRDEVQACSIFLRAQIKQIDPKVILSVGRISAHSLLQSTSPVGKLIQDIHQLPESNIPIKVTYHPAYLLRNPSAKSITWQDMKTLHRILGK